MAISHVSEANNNGTSGSEIVVTLGAHATDDLLVATCHGGGNIYAVTDTWSVTTGTGWAKLYDLANAADGRDKGQAVFYKKATSGAETNPGFTQSNTGQATVFTCAVNVFRGVDGVNPLDVTAVDEATYEANYCAAGANAPNGANKAITTNSNGAWVIICNGHGHDRTSVTPPTGYTLTTQVISATANFNRNLMVAYKEVAAAGAETPGVWGGTVNGSADFVRGTIALRPAVAGGGLSIPVAMQQYTRLRNG